MKHHDSQNIMPLAHLAYLTFRFIIIIPFSRMLITLIDKKNGDKKVLHRYPYERITLEQESLEKSNPSDIQKLISDTFDQLGLFRNEALIPTSTTPLPARAVFQIFIANQTNSQIVLGIDDDCVLVSRSAFLRQHPASSQSERWAGESAQLVEEGDQCESEVSSISLIWRLDNYDGVEEAKHRLSFLLGVLQRKEQQNQYLTRALSRIALEEASMKKRIKDLLAINSRNGTQNYEEIRLKILTRQIDAHARHVRQKIGVFQLLREYYESWVHGRAFEVREDGGVWQGGIGRRVAVAPPSSEFSREVEHKTVVMLPPKLAEMLPPALYSDRVKRLYEKGLGQNHHSFKKLLERNGELNAGGLYHTVHFLLSNNLAVQIYPINPPTSYNLFALRCLPPRSSIDKFNHRIFPGRNFLQVVSPYSGYKLARQEEETLKYLLLKEVVGQVGIYVYRKYAESEGEGSDPMLEELLSKYSMGEKDLNHLLAVQPLAYSKEGNLLTSIVKFIRQNSKHWGFYFIE